MAKEYIKQGYNASATIKKLEPHLKPATAKLKAHRMITSEIFKKSLAEVMEEKGLTDEVVSQIHERNLKQSKSLPASNEAINIYHKLKGNFAPEKKLTLNINVNDPKAVESRIAELEQELSNG